jgi:hypothetical protein
VRYFLNHPMTGPASFHNLSFCESESAARNGGVVGQMAGGRYLVLFGSGIVHFKFCGRPQSKEHA